MPRNYDPTLHPLQVPREYTRALNATKLERVFAKPFIGSLDGHKDGVHTLCKHPAHLSILLSGSCDGEIKIWNLATRKCLQTLTAHEGFVRGLCMNQSASTLISCGNDKIIKQWRISDSDDAVDGIGVAIEPIQTIVGKHFYTCVDHHQRKPIFVTSGESIEVWDEQYTEPIKTYSWGCDSHYSVKLNQVCYFPKNNVNQQLFFNQKGARSLQNHF